MQISATRVLVSVTDVSRVYHHTFHVPPATLCISDACPAATCQLLDMAYRQYRTLLSS